jgi:hypothetical protein
MWLGSVLVCDRGAHEREERSGVLCPLDDFDVAGYEILGWHQPFCDVEEGFVAGLEHDVGGQRAVSVANVDGGASGHDGDDVVVDVESDGEVGPIRHGFEDDPQRERESAEVAGFSGVGSPVEGSAEAGEFPQDPIGSAAEVGQFVGAVSVGLVNKAAVGEFGEARAEQVRGDAEAFVEFLVSGRSCVEVAQDEQRPSIADGVERSGDRAQQVVVAFGSHMNSIPKFYLQTSSYRSTLVLQVTNSRAHPETRRKSTMRMMMRARIPVEAGNVGLTDGTLPATLQEVMAMVEPEAVYIGTDQGLRCVTIVFDLKDSSDIPAVTEPFFLKANASVELLPVMNQDDLRAGMAKLG